MLGDIRIMMVTTETSTSNVEQALAAGANEYLMKPFTREILQEKLALLGIG
jgi:two-component system chemotaxis response regulator CheY